MVSVRRVRGGFVANVMWRNARDRCTVTSGGCEVAELVYGTVISTGPSLIRAIPHSSAAVL